MSSGEQNPNDRADQGSLGLDPNGVPEKSPAGRQRPIPEAHLHIEVNFCRTPGCENFGIPPRRGPISRGDGATPDRYRLIGQQNQFSSLNCQSCRKSSRLKSNQAVWEEYERQRLGIFVAHPLRCPSEDCPNGSGKEPDPERLFRRYGKTHSGSDRWQCRACLRTFSLGKPTRRQRKPHLNAETFSLIVNKVSIRRMSEILGLSASSLYGKIDFLYEQCRAFSASRENNLPGMAIPRLYLATDRQDYLVNWGDRASRKTIQLTAIATVDRESQYIFGLTPNFDPSVDPEAVERDIATRPDSTGPVALRRYARIWTRSDYAQSLKVARDATSDQVATRDDLDAPELVSDGQQLPRRGAQVHADYLMHGHYWHLRRLFRSVEKVRLSLDQDHGLLHAAMGAFSERVRDRTADIIQVQIQKEMTIDDKRRYHHEAKTWFRTERARFPNLSDAEARSRLLTEIVQAKRAESSEERFRLRDAWVPHPFPDMAEPVKRWRFVTDLDDYGDAHVANLLLLSTLWPVDMIFNRIRRRLAAFERPVSSVRRARRLWQIYAPYDAGMLEKYLTIFRVWHNYVWVNANTGKTAAETLGLAKGKIRIQDIVYFDVRNFI